MLASAADNLKDKTFLRVNTPRGVTRLSERSASALAIGYLSGMATIFAIAMPLDPKRGRGRMLAAPMGALSMLGGDSTCWRSAKMSPLDSTYRAAIIPPKPSTLSCATSNAYVKLAIAPSVDEDQRAVASCAAAAHTIGMSCSSRRRALIC